MKKTILIISTFDKLLLQKLCYYLKSYDSSIKLNCSLFLPTTNLIINTNIVNFMQISDQHDIDYLFNKIDKWFINYIDQPFIVRMTIIILWKYPKDYLSPRNLLIQLNKSTFYYSKRNPIRLYTKKIINFFKLKLIEKLAQFKTFLMFCPLEQFQIVNLFYNAIRINYFNPTKWSVHVVDLYNTLVLFRNLFILTLLLSTLLLGANFIYILLLKRSEG